MHAVLTRSFAGALLGALALTGCSSDPKASDLGAGQYGSTPTSSATSSKPSPAVTASTSAADLLEATLTGCGLSAPPKSLTAVPRTDPRAVAGMFGCAYFVHPVQESPVAHATRLAPLSTAVLTAQIADLSLNGLGSTRIDASLIAVDPVTAPLTFRITVITQTNTAAGVPAADDSRNVALVRVVRQPDGLFLADSLVFNG